MTATEILVIILSIFLAFFLLLSIILVVYLINLTREIRKVTMSAERAVDSIQSVVSGISKAVSPIFIAKMVGNIFKKYSNNKKGKCDDVED